MIDVSGQPDLRGQVEIGAGARNLLPIPREAYFERVPEHVLTVVDQAYFEYIDRPDYPDGVAEYLRAGRRVLVLRTFSKIYGLAGLRVGYGVGPADVIAAIGKTRRAFDVDIERAVLILALISLSLAVGGPASLGAFVPGVERNYDTTMAASTVSSGRRPSRGRGSPSRINAGIDSEMPWPGRRKSLTLMAPMTTSTVCLAPRPWTMSSKAEWFFTRNVTAASPCGRRARWTSGRSSSRPLAGNRCDDGLDGARPADPLAPHPAPARPLRRRIGHQDVASGIGDDDGVADRIDEQVEAVALGTHLHLRFHQPPVILLEFLPRAAQVGDNVGYVAAQVGVADLVAAAR